MDYYLYYGPGLDDFLVVCLRTIFVLRTWIDCGLDDF